MPLWYLQVFLTCFEVSKRCPVSAPLEFELATCCTRVTLGVVTLALFVFAGFGFRLLSAGRGKHGRA